MFVLNIKSLLDSTVSQKAAIEYLKMKNVKERSDILSFVIGLGLQSKTSVNGNVSLSKEESNEIGKEFNVHYLVEVEKLLTTLKENGLIIPTQSIISNAKSIFIARFTLSRHDFWNVYEIAQTGIKPEWKEGFHKTALKVMNKDWSLSYDAENEFHKILEDAINEVYEETKLDIPLDAWRSFILDQKSTLKFLINGNVSCGNEFTQKVAIELFKNKLGLFKEIEVDAVYEGINNLVIVNKNNNFGLEDINVAGLEEEVFYSDGVEEVTEYLHLDNLAKALTNHIYHFKNDLSEHEKQIDIEEYVGTEDYKETIEKILHFLQIHAGKLLPAIIAMILALLFFMNKKTDKESTGSKNLDELNKLKAKINAKKGPLPTKEELGISSVKSTAFLTGHIMQEFNTELDYLFLSNHTGYTPHEIEKTLNAHLEAIKFLVENLGNMFNEYREILLHQSNSSEVTNVTLKIKDLYLQDDFFKLKYTKRPLFDFITKYNGYLPYSSKLFSESNRVINYKEHTGEKFWQGDFLTTDGRRAETMELKPYSNLMGKHDNSQSILEESKKILPFDESNVNKIKLEAEKEKSKISRILKDLESLQKTIPTTYSLADKKDIVWPPGANRHHPKSMTAENLATSLMASDCFRSRLGSATVVANSILDLYAVVKRISSLRSKIEKYRAYLVQEEKEYNDALIRKGYK